MECPAAIIFPLHFACVVGHLQLWLTKSPIRAYNPLEHNLVGNTNDTLVLIRPTDHYCIDAILFIIGNYATSGNHFSCFRSVLDIRNRSFTLGALFAIVWEIVIKIICNARHYVTTELWRQRLLFFMPATRNPQPATRNPQPATRKIAHPVVTYFFYYLFIY